MRGALADVQLVGVRVAAQRDAGVGPRGAGEAQQAIGRDAVEAAARYAGEHRSLALIVSRHDHIVFERYWQGTGFDTPADAQHTLCAVQDLPATSR